MVVGTTEGTGEADGAATCWARAVETVRMPAMQMRMEILLRIGGAVRLLRSKSRKQTTPLKRGQFPTSRGKFAYYATAFRAAATNARTRAASLRRGFPTASTPLATSTP